MGQDPPIQPPSGGVTAGSTPTDSQGRPLAEWWKRVVASILDGIIVGIPANIVGGIIFGSLFAARTPTYNPVTGQIEGAGFIAGILAAQGAFFIAYLILTAGYYIYFHGKTGQTLGKKVMKIQVVSQTTGDVIGNAAAFKRWLLPGPLSIITCGIGGLLDGLWPLWDPNRQALHDKFVGSVVIDLGP